MMSLLNLPYQPESFEPAIWLYQSSKLFDQAKELESVSKNPIYDSCLIDIPKDVEENYAYLGARKTIEQILRGGPDSSDLCIENER